MGGVSMETYKLSDLCVILDAKRKPLSALQRAKKQGIYPYYGAQGIIDHLDDYLLDGEYLLVAEDGANLETRNQPIANIAKGKIWVNNHAHVLGNNGKCPLNLLGFILNNMNISPYVTGCAQPKLNQENLKNIEIELPSHIDSIASILSSLDRKIELNNKINADLEEMAQAIFKNWFVDFEPFKDSKFVDSELGMIPEGWKVGTLEDIAEITMGQSPAGNSLNENREGMIFYQGSSDFGFRFPSIRVFTTEPKRLAVANSVLFSVRAPVGDINVAKEVCCIGRGVASIKSKYGHDSYLFYAMKSLHKLFDSFDGEGTVFGSINKKTLSAIQILLPSDGIVEQFNNIASSFDDRIRSLSDENSRLSLLRDTLLPRLMSGELEVPE